MCFEGVWIICDFVYMSCAFQVYFYGWHHICVPSGKPEVPCKPNFGAAKVNDTGNTIPVRPVIVDVNAEKCKRMIFCNAR